VTQAALLGEEINCGLLLYNILRQERLYLYACVLYMPRDWREKLRLTAVSAIVFSPRPASVIGGFISRTKNPKISTWTIQNALF